MLTSAAIKINLRKFKVFSELSKYIFFYYISVNK